LPEEKTAARLVSGGFFGRGDCCRSHKTKRGQVVATACLYTRTNSCK